MVWAILALIGVPLWLCALGILSVVVCAPLGIAAWKMGSSDLSAMRGGRMDRAGESVTYTGYVLGIVGTVLFGLQLVAACLGFAVAGAMLNQMQNDRKDFDQRRQEFDRKWNDFPAPKNPPGDR